MPCYKPLTGYYSKYVNKSGKRSIVFNSDKALIPVKQQVPCGRCIGCRLDRSLSWAIRCVNEASMYDENSFITLTFDDDHIADNRSLRVSDFQKFMKRLRKAISPRKVRFFHCGEYGAKFSRPHHHACLFGYDFSDKVLFSERNGSKVYTSAMLSNLWPFGFSTVGSVTFESAAYVARYVMKKWAKDNFSGVELYDAMKALKNPQSKADFYNGMKEEYITMSRRPGIGETWYKQFSSDVYPLGFCVVNGKKVKPPRYYDNQFEIDNSLSFARIKVDRLKGAQGNINNTPARLEVREELKKRLTNQLTRGYENEVTSI